MKSVLHTGLLLGFFFVSMTLYAQDQWTWTQQLKGNWKGQATITLGEASFEVTYHMQFKSSTQGAALTMEEYFNDADLGNFRGTNLIGLSASDGLIHWFSVDNFGTAHDHTGIWSDNKNFSMQHQSPSGDQEFLEVIDFKLNANNTQMDVTLQAFLDGVLFQTISGTMKRSNGNNSPQISFGTTQQALQRIEETLVFPNPSSGEVFIESPETISNVVLHNDRGVIVHTASPDSETYSFTISTPGTYILHITQGGERFSKTLIVGKY